MHQLIDITLIACSVSILILYPSIAYCRSIIKIRTLNGATNNGTGTTYLIRKNIQKIQRPKPKKKQDTTACIHYSQLCIYI